MKTINYSIKIYLIKQFNIHNLYYICIKLMQMSLFIEKQTKIISVIVFMLLTANLNAQILADINDTIFLPWNNGSLSL